MSQKVIYDGNPDAYNHLIESGYSFHFGEYINRGWEIFKQYPGGFIGFMFLLMLIAGVASMIPVAGVGVAYALSAGIFIVADKIAKGDPYEFGDFFKGFDHFLQLMIAGLLMQVFIGVGFVLLIIPGIYLAIAYSMVVPLITLGKLEFWPAMEVSRKVISKNWWMFLLFTIVIGFLAMIGIVALIIGMFVTLPLFYTMTYAAYEDIFAPVHDDMESLIHDIGEEESNLE